jgi:hypothetical protein
LGTGQEEGRGVVVALEDKTTAKEFVALGVGGASKSIENLEVGFFDGDGGA